MNEATIEDLKQFFDDFALHFSQADVEDFIEEVSVVSIEDIPGVMQDSIECSYK